MRLHIPMMVLVLAITPMALSQQLSNSNPERAIQAAIAAHDFSRAVELAQAELQRSPQNAKAWTLAGIALSSSGRAKEALDAYEHALKISPDFLPALEGAAELEYNQGDSKAAALLERILQLHPGNQTAHAMLGVLAYKRRDCASAVTHFGASKQTISSQRAALAQFGSCLVQLQRPEEAIPAFERLLALEPGDPHARYNLAVVQFNAHHSQDAVTTLQPLVESAQPDPDVLDLASSAYEETGDTPTAVKLLRQAIILDPKRTKYYVDFATISFAHQSFQVGVDVLNAGLKENPNSPALHVARGILYIQLGDYEKGEADFESANKLDPRETSGAIAESLAQMQQSNLDQALATAQKELKNHPQDAFLHYMQAQALFQQGADPDTPQFKQATAAAKRAVELRPDFALAHDLLGNLYLKSGEVEKSIEQSRRALELNPSDQEALYHLIQALRKTKDAKGELPALVKRLATLREQSRNTEAAQNRYKLYEPSEPPPTR